MRQKILCYGGSNTCGCAPGPGWAGYPKAVRWTGKLEAAGREAVSQGENGRAFFRSGPPGLCRGTGGGAAGTAREVLRRKGTLKNIRIA